MINKPLITRTEVSNSELVKDTTTIGRVTTHRISHLERLGNVQGTKLVKYKTQTITLKKVIRSPLDWDLTGYLIDNMNSYNIVVKLGSKVPITTEYLAKKFGISIQKVQKFMHTCIKAGLLCRSKKTFIMNPYIYIPFSSRRDAAENDQVVYQMQTWWRGDKKALPTIITANLEELEKASRNLGISEVDSDNFDKDTKEIHQ